MFSVVSSFAFVESEQVFNGAEPVGGCKNAGCTCPSLCAELCAGVAGLPVDVV